MDIEKLIKKNISLKEYATFKIGGSVKYMLEVSTKDDLTAALAWAKAKGLLVYILGGGSNTLINDQSEIDGLVIKLNTKDICETGKKVVAGAGCGLGELVAFYSKGDVGGMEWAVAIPGTVGGAIVGNAGAYGSDMSSLVIEVEAYDRDQEKFLSLPLEDCGFTYRNSMFKNQSRYIIWSVMLTYDKTRLFDKALMDKYLTSRMDKFPKYPSAGSIFKNVIADDLKLLNPRLYAHAEETGQIKGGKIAAGWIIDLLDVRGKVIGGAKVSEEHANFIVNTGNATAEDVAMLISYVKQQIRDKYHLNLVEEIVYLGF